MRLALALLALLPTVAAAKSRPKRLSPAACQAKRLAVDDLYVAKKYDQAASAAAAGYAACGPGYGFLFAQGLTLATQGKREDAARLYIQEVSEPSPQARVYPSLQDIRDQLPEPLRRQIAALGRTVEQPVHVRGAQGAASWSRTFTCLGETLLHGLVRGRATGPSTDRKRPVDYLEFNCSDGIRHRVHFIVEEVALPPR